MVNKKVSKLKWIKIVKFAKTVNNKDILDLLVDVLESSNIMIEKLSSQCKLAEKRWKQNNWLKIDWWVIDQ